MTPKERTNDRLIAVFTLGVLMFCPLPLQVFDAGADGSIWGVPLLVLYVFAAWGILILLIGLAARNLAASEPPSEFDDHNTMSGYPDA